MANESEILKKLIKQNKTIPEIANLLGLTKGQVDYKLNKYKLRKKFKRQTNWFNQDFTNITNEEAYILGFLWADGYLNGTEVKSNLQCEIVYNDFKDIEKIFDKTGDWSRLFRKASNKNGIKRQKRTCLTISDRALIRKFILFDFDKKSYLPPTKLLKLIPTNKHYLFYRGYFDGDGCFYITDKANQFSIGSQYNQDWMHIEKLFKLLKIDKYHIQRRISNKGHKLSQIRVFSRDSVTKIARYVYQDKTSIGLKRKFSKVSHLL
jgi:hypothetical protein